VDWAATACIVATDKLESPSFLEIVPGMPPARELVVCRNGILHPYTRRIWEHTPAVFTYYALPYDYDPNAPRPESWLQFLHTIFGGNPQAIRELQKTFGYVLTTDTSQQKIFGLVGPDWGSMETILGVMRRLVGSCNTCALGMSELANKDRLRAMFRKQLVIIRKVGMGRKGAQKAIAERLMNISGEDTIEVRRSHKKPWSGELDVRLCILSEEPITIHEPFEKLGSRYVSFQCGKTFPDREDGSLHHRLQKEKCGILNWALDGLNMFREDRYIKTPDST
jgi:putative DNA primase/helicase